MYRHLNPDKIVETLAILNKRIEERFPDSGIFKVSLELLKTGREAKSRAIWIGSPLWSIRVLTWALVGLIAVTFWLGVLKLNLRVNTLSFAEFIQVLESGINDIVFLGIGVFFLVTLETRIKRKRVLGLLHELRAMAHVIDMHQLTKDPESLLTSYQQTKSSPRRSMSAFELQRYLDYCSELLALIGKIAALYVQNFEDEEAVDVVNEIESLTTGLSGKIWYKIMVLQQYQPVKS